MSARAREGNDGTQLTRTCQSVRASASLKRQWRQQEAPRTRAIHPVQCATLHPWLLQRAFHLDTIHREKKHKSTFDTRTNGLKECLIPPTAAWPFVTAPFVEKHWNFTRVELLSCFIIHFCVFLAWTVAGVSPLKCTCGSNPPGG